MKLTSPFQWMKLDTCLGLYSNWSLFNKKDTSSLSKGNFSTTNGHLLLSGRGKMGRRKGTNDHYRIIYTDRRSTSRGEMELMPHMEATSAFKTSWQHWCIPRLWGDYSTGKSSPESKLEKIVCWERSSIREKLPVVGEMHEQKLVYWRLVVKVSSGIFWKGVWSFSCAPEGHQNWGQSCWGMVLGNKVEIFQAGKFLWHLSGPVGIWSIFNVVIGLKDTMQKKIVITV